jgi:hypothetical protein
MEGHFMKQPKAYVRVGSKKKKVLCKDWSYVAFKTLYWPICSIVVEK